MNLTTLNEELQKISASTPLELHMKLHDFIRQQQESGEVTGLQVGEKAKDFSLTDTFGNEVNLYTELGKGPVVLTFYRGGWCPFCNRQLKAYQDILPQIHAAGAELIAISPQLPDQSLTAREKISLEFMVLSDIKGNVSSAYNLLYEVPEELKQLYLNIGIDLTEYNGTDQWILPVPATFMIDESATVRFAYVNPNFMTRVEPEDILWQLNAL